MERQMTVGLEDVERFVGRLWIKEQFMSAEVERLLQELEEARREIEELKGGIDED